MKRKKGIVFMKKSVMLFIFLSLMHTHVIFSSATVIQNLALSVDDNTNITTSGNPATLAVTLDSNGNGSATNNSTTYTVFSNTSGKSTLKITGQISSGGNMPTNTSLTICLSSTKGKSLGTQTLSTTAINLVNKLSKKVNDTGVITYTFNVTNGWNIAVQTLNRTVTLTLTSDS